MNEPETRAEAQTLMDSIERVLQFADKHEAYLVSAKLADALEAMRQRFLSNFD